MSCLIKGTNLLLKNISDEAFVFERHANPQYVFQHADPNVFPYLLVNVGSGVSVMKVMGEETYERIGGTATGENETEYRKQMCHETAELRLYVHSGCMER